MPGGGAHPRGCGADVFVGGFAHELVGSSPRVRGRHPKVPLPHQRIGLIPAGAGQTRVSRPGKHQARAHPRGCGADVPLTWGRKASPGLIPAGAGQTGYCGLSLLLRWAHPRGCGADAISACAPFEREGSSPRVRGRRRHQRRLVLLLRLIPAGAGQTSRTAGTRSAGGTHPRGCGADALPQPPLSAA